MSISFGTMSVKITSSSTLAEIFDNKNIHAYFLSGGKQDRIENCLKMMSDFGLEKRHYDFINGPMTITDDEIVTFQRNGSLSMTFNQSKHEMGIGRFLCQLGKLRVLNAFLASDFKEMILFEDDVNVPNTHSIVEAISYTRLMLSIPTEKYDIQYLGYCFECNRHSPNDIHGLYKQVLMPLCNHAVLFKRKAVIAFMELSKPFKMPGDYALAHAICETGMNLLLSS